jgi:hypothetical protein
MARTYGRVKNPDGSRSWVKVETDANGDNSYLFITTLIQVLLLNLGESPFYANYGIPAQRSVLTQIFPDYYVTVTQQQFAQFFARLSISKVPSTTPTYDVSLQTLQGAIFEAQIAE